MTDDGRDAIEPPTRSMPLAQVQEMRTRDRCPVCGNPIDALVVDEAEGRVQIMHSIAPIAWGVCRIRIEKADEH